MVKKLFVFILFISLTALAFIPTIGRTQDPIACNIIIDRSAVPSLYYNSLTLLVQVNDGTDFAVSDGATFTQDGDRLVVTSAAEAVTVSFTPGSNTTDLCATEKAPLRDNKKWAWSHGFDDNVNLAPAINEFLAKSWPATIFAIAKSYDQTRNEPWITDEPYFNSTLLPAGWALGNHSWNHERFDTSSPTAEDYRKDIRDGQTRLEAGIGRSSHPNFKVMVFASPNFSAAYDQPFAEVAATTDLVLLESGNDFMLNVTGNQEYVNGPITAHPLPGRTKIGRDIRIEFDLPSIISTFDWMAANATDGRYFWYNTLAHGSHEINIRSAIDHVYNNYEQGGTNEAWVASSSEIYSYILIRDGAQVSFSVGDAPQVTATATTAAQQSTETATFTPTPTPVPTETPNPAETPSLTLTPPTKTPIPLPSPVDDELNNLYLPIITNMKLWLSKQILGEQNSEIDSVLLRVSSHGLKQMKSAD